MKSSNVVDFFSRQSYLDITTKDSKANDDLTEKYGVYLGCLMKKDAKLFRNIMGELDFKRQQINQLTEDWERLYVDQQELLNYCLNFLKNPITKNINLEKDTVMVSENGHTWVIYDFEKVNQE
jgi:hypothetical protein